MLKNLYILAWSVCCLSWAAVLLSFRMSFGFLGCDGRIAIVAAVCRLVDPFIVQYFVIAGISLPVLTLVFLVRMLVRRKWWALELFLFFCAWTLFACVVPHIPTS